MKYKDIVNKVSKTTGIEKRNVKLIIDTFFDVVKASLYEGKDVKLSPKFGIFKIVNVKNKKVRNLQNNTLFVMPDYKKVVWKQPRNLKHIQKEK